VGLEEIVELARLSSRSRTSGADVKTLFTAIQQLAEADAARTDRQRLKLNGSSWFVLR